MAKETAIVTGIDGEYAMVRTQRTDGCAACSEKNLCSALGGGKDMEFAALNPAGANPGDTVLLDFKAVRLLQLSFLLYIFPIGVLVAGAVIGDALAPAYGIDASAGAAGLGFASFFMAIGVILLLERKARKSDKYKPVVISVKRTASLGPAPPPEQCEHAKPTPPQ